MIARDFAGPDVPDVEAKRLARRPLLSSITGALRMPYTTAQRHHDQSSVPLEQSLSLNEAEKGRIGENQTQEMCYPVTGQGEPLDCLSTSPSPSSKKRVTFSPQGTPETRVSASPLPITPVLSITSSTVFEPEGDIESAARQPQAVDSHHTGCTHFFLKTFQFARLFITPLSVAICVSFPIALVQPLKAMFVPSVPPSTIIPLAPDGNPPLFFIYDTAQFIGAASIPLGLVCLGSALAKMEIQRPLVNAPLGAIFSLAVCKMIILPIIGVCIVQGLTYGTGLIDPNDKVLRFVCM